MANITITERQILDIVDKYPESKKAINELFPFTLKNEYKVGDKFQWGMSNKVNEGVLHTIVLIEGNKVGDLSDNVINNTVVVENVNRITDYELRLLFSGGYFDMRKINGDKLICL